MSSAWVAALIAGVVYIATKKSQLQNLQQRAMTEYYGNKKSLGPGPSTQDVRVTFNTNNDNRFLHMSTDLTHAEKVNLHEGSTNMENEAREFDARGADLPISGMGSVLFYDS